MKNPTIALYVANALSAMTLTNAQATPANDKIITNQTAKLCASRQQRLHLLNKRMVFTQALLRSAGLFLQHEM